jgi:transposase
MIRYVVTLSRDERESLDVLVKTGEHRSRMVLNALILLACDEGAFQAARSTNEEIARVLGVSMRKIDRVKKRYVTEGLEAALNHKKGERLYTRKVDGDFEAHLVALSCSTPPDGYARWSLRLLADKVVELGYIDSISHESIRNILKKTRLNRGSGKGG